MALVYSSIGRLCNGCHKLIDDCVCKAKSDLPQIVTLQRQTKGRGGKTVIVASGFTLPDAEIKQLLKEIQQKCATGGTLIDGGFEIRGENLDKIKIILTQNNIKFKQIGG